jgi:hypothetical protein
MSRRKRIKLLEAGIKLLEVEVVDLSNRISAVNRLLHEWQHAWQKQHDTTK